MEINELTGIVVSSCIKIHNKLGPGCFEKVYEEVLYYELQKQGILVHRQLMLPIAYEGLHIEMHIKLIYL